MPATLEARTKTRETVEPWMTAHIAAERVCKPVIDPDDYDNETDYINAIPGMRESILAALAAPRSEYVDVPDDWIDDDV